MTGNEVAVRAQASAIPAKLAYAHELANSGLLPAQYRRNPANVLWAMEYGEMLGLAPMAAMTGVHVIEGKPTASAGLISGLVRQAGHRLRVWGDNKSATCEITRSDDPEHLFSVTWTLRKEPGDNPSAEVAQLLTKKVWREYPASMLKSRAITQCARDACEEVLFGLHYTPEELGAEVDEDGVVLAEVVDDEASGQQKPAQAADPAQGSEYWYASPSPEQQWLASAVETALGHETLEACKADWQQSVQAVNDGKLTRDEVAGLHGRLRARIKELGDARPAESGEAQAGDSATAAGADEFAGLDPDDTWTLKVEGIADTGEAAEAIREATALFAEGRISEEKHEQICAAIDARFPQAAELAA